MLYFCIGSKFRVDIERERFIINNKDLYIISSDMHYVCGTEDLLILKV